jgi:hypothetical protein
MAITIKINGRRSNGRCRLSCPSIRDKDRPLGGFGEGVFAERPAQKVIKGSARMRRCRTFSWRWPSLGFLIIGLFVFSWLGSAIFYRLKGFDELETSSGG